MSLLAKAMTEDELLTAITDAATYLGWRWFHIRRSDLARQMGHSGFPDLVLARKGRVLFMELKSEKGGIAPDQHAWMDALDSPERYVTAIIARPSQLDYVLRMLA